MNLEDLMKKEKLNIPVDRAQSVNTKCGHLSIYNVHFHSYGH